MLSNFSKACSVIKMREVLIDKSHHTDPVEIPQNTSGTNDFIKTLLQSTKNKLSVELSPKSFDTHLLTNLAPQFVSVTWFGLPQLELPIEEITAIALSRELCSRGYPVLQHVAGRNLNQQQMKDVLNQLKSGGIRNILALQGDWPNVVEKDDNKCDFPYAVNLVSYIKKHYGDQFCIGVAGYPDTHPHSKNRENDVHYLEKKVFAGADFIITQAVFEYETLEKFAKTCRERKINIPILAGIFVMKSYKSIIGVAKRCQFQIPSSVLEFLEKNKDKDDVIENYGLELATNLIKNILSNQKLFAGVHIFSLNDLNFVQKLVSDLKMEDVK